MLKIAYALAAALIFLPMTASGNDGPEYLFDSFEGEAPRVHDFAVKGEFTESKHKFAMFAKRNAGSWLIGLSYRSRGTSAVRLVGPDYSDIDPLRIKVALVPGSTTSNSMIAVIPYGEAMTGCFGNGREVFRQIEIILDEKGFQQMSRRTFVDCNPVQNEYKVTNVRSMTINN